MYHIEQERIDNGESEAICSHKNCVRGIAANPDTSRLCTAHLALKKGKITYDMRVALGLEGEGLIVTKIDDAVEPKSAYCPRIKHAPDATIAEVLYGTTDDEGYLGHQIVIANDGGQFSGHDGYGVKKEYDDAMCESASMLLHLSSCKHSLNSVAFHGDSNIHCKQESRNHYNHDPSLVCSSYS
jgi:hypothetical protein